MTENGILVEERGRVAILTMYRPALKNAFDEHMFWNWTGQPARFLKCSRGRWC